MMVREVIEEIDGCTVMNISSKTGKVTVDFSDLSIEPKIREAIRSIWYKLIEEDNNIGKIWRFDKINILWIFFALLLVLFISNVNLNGFIPTYDKLGFGIAFLVGLVASVSTCLAVTWGIIIGYTESIVDKTNGWKTQLRFHMGRLITFIVWGFILGMIGQSFSASMYFNGVLSIVIGLILAYLGMQILGILPNISQWGFHFPMILSRNITKLKNPKYSPLVWAFTFLLPCGFTQSMVIFALSSHNPWQWAIVMGWFALGTLPVLLALGLWTEYIKDHLKKINPFIASLLLVFGIFTMMNGYRIIEATTVSDVTSQISSPVQDNILPNTSEIEQVPWSHDWYGFSPQVLILQKWKKYLINVIPQSDWLGCKYSVILPWVWEKFIKKWQAFTINVDGSESKTIRLVCGSMGMRQWEIVVQ